MTSKRVFAVSGPFFEPWDYSNSSGEPGDDGVVRGIGGSETAQTEIARRLADRGYDVTSFSPTSWNGSRKWRGVNWANVSDVDTREPGTWILYRCPHFLDSFPATHPEQRIALSSQDVDYPTWTPERTAKLDCFQAICETHRQHIATRHPELAHKMVVIPNGVKVDLIEQIEAEGKIERNPRKMIWASSPDRGLEALLVIFKRAREWVSGLELAITYSFFNIDRLIESGDVRMARLKDRIMKLADQPGVTFKGRMSQPDLYRERLSCGLMCHPSLFSETGFCSLLEAQACGCVPITTPIWAAAEYTLYGQFIIGDCYTDPLTQARYVGAIYEWCKNPEYQEKTRQQMMKDAREKFDWERVVDQIEEKILHVNKVSVSVPALPDPVHQQLIFHLYSPTHMESWDWTNTQTGIGGIETSIAEVAWRLAKLGHEVNVYTSVPWDSGSRAWRGTSWQPHQEADFSRPGVWLLYRCPEVVERLNGNMQAAWLVVQDWDHPWKMEQVNRLDRILVLCETHKTFLLSRHPELSGKISVTSNGVRVELLEAVESIPDRPARNPKKIIYASSPDRGLLTLLKIFAKAQAGKNDLELHIFYGFNGVERLVEVNPDFAPFLKQRDEMNQIASTVPGVFFRGRVTQELLYQEWLSAGMWAYPTAFAELSCITGQEAQCMGAIPIVTPVWAQGENTKHGAMIPGGPNLESTMAAFAEKIRYFADHPEEQERIRAVMMPEARQRCNWDRHVAGLDRMAQQDMEVRPTKVCRGCGHKQLLPVLDLGEQPVAGYFPKPDEPVRRFPLALVRCASCDLGQLSHTVSRGLLFGGEYGYRSGANRIMREHLEKIAMSVEIGPGDLWVDIGCNDGTLLRFLPPKNRVGFDPSEVCPPQYHREFFSAKAFERLYPGKKANVVTSLAMFYDLEDPFDFACQVRRVLADDGVWIIELQNLARYSKTGAFDTVCHEHLTYWDLPRIEDLLHGAGFAVTRHETNDVNGGTLQVWACKGAHIHHYQTPENDWGGFVGQVKSVTTKLRDLMASIPKDAVVWGYGASTKGNVLLQYTGIADRLSAVADINPQKWGRVLPGTQIPIKSEEDMRSAKPDYLLALPWAFIDEFLRREPGMKFIVPFPEPRIVEAPVVEIAEEATAR